MKKNKFLTGVIITLGVVLLTTGCGKTKLKNGEEVAIKINGKSITADTLYSELRDKYAKYQIVNDIDKKIFDSIYKDDEEIASQVETQYEYYESQYKNSGSSLEEAIKTYGYKDVKEFKEELKLNIERSKAVDDYIKDNIKNTEIQKYYDENIVGDISAKHILVKVNDGSSEDGLSDEEALNKANELIDQLNNGADFSELAQANSDDTGSAANGGDLGYFNKGQMVQEFEEAAYALGVNEYTKEPVKTTYGYHIILKTGEKEKASLEDSKEKILTDLLAKKKEEDSTIQVTTLDKIRKNYGLKFKDSKLKAIYKEYLNEQKESLSQ